MGGKRALAKRVIAIFPEHTTYVEAFAGGAQVFFHKEPSKVEVHERPGRGDREFLPRLPAASRGVAPIFPLLRREPQSFELQKATDPATLTDIQRAARYMYLLKSSFASLVRNPNYHWHVVQPPGFNLERLPELIENAHKRLERVQIECLPYEEVLKRYDRPTTLFYLDPPYFGRSSTATTSSRKTSRNFAERLRRLRGKFVLSLNDVPEVRALFHRFHIQGRTSSPTPPKRISGRRYGEVFITNFKP